MRYIAPAILIGLFFAIPDHAPAWATFLLVCAVVCYVGLTFLNLLMEEV